MFLLSVTIASLMIIYALLELILNIYNKKPLWKIFLSTLKKILNAISGI